MLVSISFILCWWISIAITSPLFFISSARTAVFPPGAAQISKTNSFGITPRFLAAKYDEASWAIILPVLNSSEFIIEPEFT